MPTAYALHEPLTFIHTPFLCLQLMARHGCEFASAPDFTFRLVVRKWVEAKHKGNVLLKLDLSCLRALINASEPVHQDTRELFTTTFSPCGLHDMCMTPAYGLAENVVMYDISMFLYVLATPLHTQVWWLL